jgi:N-acetylmuramoyl-L-alanine amidase
MSTSAMLTRLLITPILCIVAWGMMLGGFAPDAYSLTTQTIPISSPTTIPDVSDLEAWSPHPTLSANLPAPSSGEMGEGGAAIPNPSLAQVGQPRMVVRPANPTNFGPRFSQDINGNPVSNPLIVVLHETVGSGSSAINTMQAAQPDESRQVSYHAIILLDGTIAFVVPPEFRSFGAGNSVFNGPNGPEAVKTHPIFPASVNNFAYHISLETPVDGRHNGSGHSGYTPAQYRSVAWLVARTGVPENRVTTHRAVDRSGQRRDPRSFNTQAFSQLLRATIR